MKQKELLREYIRILDIHTNRLQTALDQAHTFMPITSQTITELPLFESYCLEVINSRFGKIQDDLGNKVFPLVLEIGNKNSYAFLDKLNLLEKDGFLESAQEWLELRKLRNIIAHDYEDDSQALAIHTNKLIIKAQELLGYWVSLKPKLQKLAE